MLQSEMEMVWQFQHRTISVERVSGRLNPGCSPSEANPGRKERMLVPLVEDSRGQEGFSLVGLPPSEEQTWVDCVDPGWRVHVQAVPLPLIRRLVGNRQDWRREDWYWGRCHQERIALE